MKPATGQPKREIPAGESRAVGSQGLLDRLTAMLLSAVITCRMLTPTDAAAMGETIWIAQLSLAALVLWALAVYWSGWLQLPFDWIDAAVLLFCLGPMIAALTVVGTTGDKRAALNMLWEWCGIGATWFLMRRVANTPADRQSLLLVVAASAVSLSGLGLWQHYRGNAQSRLGYETLKAELETLERQGPPTNPREAVEWNRALQSARAKLVQIGVPGEASARMQWEQRLNSSEPIGLFALANTLAGILASMAIVWLGLLVGTGRIVPRWQIACGGLWAGLILYCLLLTKSRTAFAGLLAGLAVWACGSRSPVQQRSGRWRWGLAAGLLIATGMISAAYATGGLDRLVVSESAKSLRYRIEYWQATCGMLLESPKNWLVGVGPGNFRQHYLRFKLPQSSEEIADPHNLLLDAWSNGGLVALVGLAGLFVAGLRPLWAEHEALSTEEPSRLFGRDFVLAGGVVGHLAVLIPGVGSDEATVLLLLFGWLAVVASCQGLFRNNLPCKLCAAAFISMLVHLLGAGGIAMPAVVQTILLLIVISAAARPSAICKIATEARWPVAVMGLAGLGLYGGCWFTGLSPVIDARSRIALGEYELFEQRRPDKAEREFHRAAAADPWSSRPYDLLAQVAFQLWVASRDGSPAGFDRAISLQNEAVARNPLYFGGHQALGEMYLVKFDSTRSPGDAALATAAFRQAVALYPNQARLQSQLAEALWKGEEYKAACVAARRASDLDAINEEAGHIDKRLTADRRKIVDQIVEECIKKRELTPAGGNLK